MVLEWFSEWTKTPVKYVRSLCSVLTAATCHGVLGLCQRAQHGLTSTSGAPWAASGASLIRWKFYLPKASLVCAPCLAAGLLYGCTFLLLNGRKGGAWGHVLFCRRVGAGAMCLLHCPLVLLCEVLRLVQGHGHFRELGFLQWSGEDTAFLSWVKGPFQEACSPPAEHAVPPAFARFHLEGNKRCKHQTQYVNWKRYFSVKQMVNRNLP